MFRFGWLCVLVFLALGSQAQAIDSLRNPLDSLVNPMDTLKFSNPLDTMRNPMASADSAYKSQMARLDSIQQNTQQALTGLNQRYDSLQQSFSWSLSKLAMRKDSLNRQGLPTHSVTAKMDSLQRVQREKLGAIRSRADSIKLGSIQKINSLELPPKVQEKVGTYTASLRDVDVGLPSTDFNVPGLDVPSLGNLNSPTLGNLPNTNLPGVSIPGTDKLGNLTPDVGNVDVSNVANVDELNKLGDVGKLNTELPNVPTDAAGAEKVLENKVADAADLKALEGLPTTPAMDEQAAKDQLTQQAKAVAMDHFAGKEEQLKAAMEKMSKYKQKYSSVQSIKDLPKKAPNPMKEKPFIERLIWGVSLQIFKKEDWLMDVNPYVGYRFTERLTVGAGWNTRAMFGGTHTQQTRVFGPRFYGEYKVLRGISGRLELETMNTFVRDNFTQSDAGQREWVPAVLAGMKKDYTIYKQLKGTALVLYNFYNPHFKSPYGDRLNIRFGFEYTFKTKRKQ
jgi:hypothetical protein